jgi:hypothetical protein
MSEVSPEWAPRLARHGLADITRLLEASPEQLGLAGRLEALTKPGLAGRERWRWQLDEPQRPVLYLKRYLGPPLRKQLDRLLRQDPRHSVGWWEHFQSGELKRQYVPAVRTIGVAEEMRARTERCSAVLFEAVPGDALDRVLVKLIAAGAPITIGPARHDLTRRLARFVGAFHQTGMRHRDLYLCHIFAELDPAGGRPPEFCLIDLARTFRPRVRRMRWLLKDLGQLDSSARQIGLTRTDRWRFLLHYLGLQTRSLRTRWYARRIVRRSNWICRRIARKSGAS